MTTSPRGAATPDPVGDLLADFRAFCYARDVEAAYAEDRARKWPGGLNPDGQPRVNPANDAAHDERIRSRASARLRGDRTPEAPAPIPGYRNPPSGANSPKDDPS